MTVTPSYRKEIDGFCYILQPAVKIQKPQLLVAMLNFGFV